MEGYNDASISSKEDFGSSEASFELLPLAQCEVRTFPQFDV